MTSILSKILKAHPIKIGVDLHGVMDKYPDFLKPLCKAAVEHGVEVHVLTGPPSEKAIEELSRAGYSKTVHYTHLHSVVDYLKSCKVEMWQDGDGNWWASEHDWWSSKAQICEDLGISVMIDNSPEYEKSFEKTKTVFILVEKR